MDVHKSQPSVNNSKVESTRYALIRRLGYVFRHHLVVNLQPLGMICQLMHHRLNATPLDIPAMRDSVDQVHRLVRTSIDASLDVVAWLTADPDACVAVSNAVGECITNVRSSFSFRGFVVRYEDAKLDTPVSQVALREVLTAALIASTDQADGLDEIFVNVQPAAPDAIDIAIQLRKGANISSAEQGAYRVLDWDDVQTLASSHGLHFTKISDAHVCLRILQFAEAPEI